jgi:hypothetical protein
MTLPPLVGKPFVVTVCEPSDFHRRWPQSRFRVSFLKREGPKWFFELQAAVKQQGARFLFIEALARNPLEPLDPESSKNSLVCRLTDGKDSGSEWTIANLAPDIERPEPLPFFPPWVSSFFTNTVRSS